MKIRILLTPILILFVHLACAQDFKQYFDGADTMYNPNSWSRSLRVVIDSDSANCWQIGRPQKNIFDSAATLPNALVTDTTNSYPTNTASSFHFTPFPVITDRGIMAIQWKQKLDMEQGFDGGKIEFSIDSGMTWHNAFNNPYVYNFYGFEKTNQDTLANGDVVFSGTDSAWRDIWLCFHLSWLSWNDTLAVRFTLVSDSNETNQEGWMIDNMLVHATVIHTVNSVKAEQYLTVYPNPSADLIHIEAQKIQGFHIIEQMALVNSAGQVIEEWHNIPTKFFIDAKKYSNGTYYLKVVTNIKTETIPIVISHN